MKTNQLLRNLSTKGLAALEKNAVKKARTECQGILFEPRIPDKLKELNKRG